MKLEHNGKTYELMETVEPNDAFITFDIIVIFEVIDRGEEEPNELRFINYFYGATDEEENLKDNAIYFIEKYEETH